MLWSYRNLESEIQFSDSRLCSDVDVFYDIARKEKGYDRRTKNDAQILGVNKRKNC